MKVELFRRALHLTFSNTTEYLGLTGYEYIADDKTLDNGTKDPRRKCYCATTHCQPSGTLNVARCKFDAPVFVSMPHFYLADESYRKNIDGMKPDRTKHEFQLAIEPVTKHLYYTSNIIKNSINQTVLTLQIYSTENWNSTKSQR